MKVLEQTSDLHWVKFWAVFNILDLVSTYKAVSGSVGVTEGNWFLSQLMSADLGVMSIAKLTMAALVAWVLVKSGKARLLKPLSIGLGLVVVWNVAVSAIFG